MYFNFTVQLTYLIFIVQDEQFQLKKELADLALSLHMEAQKSRMQDVEFEA